MTSEGLTNELTMILVESGFTVHTGEEIKMNGMIKKFPAVWLAPLKLTKLSGVNEGVGAYKGLLRIMSVNPKDERQRIKTLDCMERKWRDAVATLMQRAWVTDVKTIRIVPAEARSTGAGELSIAVEFEVEIYF